MANRKGDNQPDTIEHAKPLRVISFFRFGKPFFQADDSEQTHTVKRKFAWIYMIVVSLVSGCTLGVFAGNALCQIAASLFIAGIIFTGLAYAVFGPTGIAVSAKISALESRVQLGESTDLVKDLNQLVNLCRLSGNTAKADEYSKRLLSMVEE